MSAPVAISAPTVRAHIKRIDRRQIALQVHDDVVPAFGVERFQCVKDAVGTGRQSRVRHDCPSSGPLNCDGDHMFCRGHDDGTDVRGHGLFPDAHDHRHAGDIGQRLVR